LARCEWDLLEEAGLELEGGFQAWFDATRLEDPETLYRWRFPRQAELFYDQLYVKFVAELGHITPAKECASFENA
jgi:hypothetical protein